MAVARGPAGHRALSSPTTLAVVVMVVVTLLAYSPALHAPFLFDDATAIEHNPTITTVWPPGVALHPPTDSPVAGRPVTNYSLAVSHAVNQWFGGASPDDQHGTVGYHLFNLALHVLSGLLLFGLVRRTLAAGGPVGEGWRQHAGAAAAVVAAIWLVHPIQTEAVDYLAARSELLVSCCYLAALYCSLRAWDVAGWRRVGWYAGGFLACLLGMGAKEVMVSAPLMVVLYDRAFRANSWRDVGSAAWRGRRRYYAALGLTLVYAVVLIAASPRAGSAGFHVAVTWYDYLLTQGWAIPHYLRLVSWPAPLTLDYGEQPVVTPFAVAGVVVLVMAGLCSLWAWTRVRDWGWLAFCAAWFFCILAPSSSVIPIATEVAAERRMYLPLAAVVVVAVVGGVAIARRVLDRLARSPRPTTFRWMVVAAVVVVLAVFAELTFRRSRSFADPETIWRAAVAARPGNPRAWNNLGQVLADAPNADVATADSLFRKALALDSSYIPAMYNLAVDDIAQRRNFEAERLLQRIVAANPGDRQALGQLGALRLVAGDAAAAVPLLERATDGGDDAPTFVMLGLAYQATGRSADAAAAFRRALSIDPASQAAANALARLAH